MALVKCKECGEQVSTSAKSCPKCGAKVPKRTSAVTWVALVFVLLVAYEIAQNSGQTPSSGNSPQPRPASESSYVPPKPQWQTSTSVDQMTGKRQVYATSPTVGPTTRMKFPYGDVKAWLGAGCDGKTEWAFIGFTSSPNLSDTETGDGYNTINTRLKWNDAVQRVTLTQKWGARFVFFQNDRLTISKMASSSAALLELGWYGQGSVYFSFPLDGASSAVKAMRSECAAKK